MAKTKNKFTIIRDTREKTNHGWEFEPNDYCLGMETIKLDTGDYTIQGLENILCIERKKSISELSNNITEDRFKRFLQRMEMYRYRFIVCEFNFDKVLSFPVGADLPPDVLSKIRVTNNFLIKRISEIQVIYNIDIVFAGSKYAAQWAAFNIMKEVYRNV